jgi:hypothetical protein
MGSVEVELLSSFSFSLYLDWEMAESVGEFLNRLGAIVRLSGSFTSWELDLGEG